MFETILKSLKASLAFAVVPLLGASVLFAQEGEELSDYLERVELRSVVSLPGGTMFSIHDPESENTFWIEVGQSVNGLEAVGFNAATNRLSLRVGDSEREVGLARRRVGDPDAVNPEDLSRGERRELRREEAREQWQDFQQRFQRAAQESPEIREIREQFGELRGEWRGLREEMQGIDRDSDEFNALRERGRQLREEQRMLHRVARDVVAQSSHFEEQHVEFVDRMFGRGGSDRRRGR